MRGSHRGPTYAGTAFDPDDETTPFQPGDTYPRIPDIEADRASFDIVSFPITRGDVILFHPGLLHGGGSALGGKGAGGRCRCGSSATTSSTRSSRGRRRRTRA